MRDDVPRVHAETREQWRAWLRDQHESSDAVWLVSWKKHTGRPAVGYEAAVTEALAVGWVDSRPARLDESRTMLYFTPRRPGSGWSRPNKRRVTALERAGAMTARGRRVVETARADGSWSALDDIEDLVVPADLVAAFARHPGSAEHWNSFPRSTRRGILEWVAQARTTPTRDRRVDQTAALAARGERAAQWRPRTDPSRPLRTRGDQ